MILTELSTLARLDIDTKHACAWIDLSLSLTAIAVGIFGIFFIAALPPIGSGILIAAGLAGLIKSLYYIVPLIRDALDKEKYSESNGIEYVVHGDKYTFNSSNLK